MVKPYKIKYNTNLYNFREKIESVLETTDLENLHLIKQYDIFEVAKESKTIWHPKYYQKFQLEIYPLYVKFLEEIIKPHFRIHLHENVSVGGWHRDRDYNHTQGEINCWLPFTSAFETNTIWMESEENKSDYKPYNVEYGEVLIFDGVNLFHGNKSNQENKTRVSFDFRIVEETNFKPSEKSTLNNPTQFTIGNYFEKI
jgi:hypothetical protein